AVRPDLVLLHQAHKLDPPSSLARPCPTPRSSDLKGASLAATGNITAAIPLYQRALTLDATLHFTPAVQARLDYGHALADKGEVEPAIVMLEQAHKLDPSSSFAGLSDLTKLYQSKG